MPATIDHLPTPGAKRVLVFKGGKIGEVARVLVTLEDGTSFTMQATRAETEAATRWIIEPEQLLPLHLEVLLVRARRAEPNIFAKRAFEARYMSSPAIGARPYVAILDRNASENHVETILYDWRPSAVKEITIL